MAELLAATNYQIRILKRGQEVSGKVVMATRAEIILDIGAKSEGIVTGREFAAVRDIVSKINVGDMLEATVLYPENDAGQVVLSLRKVSDERRWNELEEKRKSGEEIEVVVIEANRGGFICDFLGLRGFLPTSQLAQGGSTQKSEELEGRKLTVVVIEVDRSSNRLIFSQKQPNKKDLGDLVKILEKVAIGEKYQGVVSAILPFGIFVEIDVEGSKGTKVTKVTKVTKANETSETFETSATLVPSKLEGLVHISEIAWEKVDDLTKLFKVQDEVNVMVVAKDTASGRVNLSIKQLLDDPFVAASQEYSLNQAVRGVVSRVTPYGVFVLLADGVEGLVHITKIGPNMEYKPGEEVECEIEAIDTAARKISLSPVVREKPVLYR